MIVYSKKRYLPKDVNMMVLEHNDAYFYIHRATYDQAVILAYKYSDKIDVLAGNVLDSVAIPPSEMREDILTAFEEMPAPIKYLAPFLYLVKGEVTEMIDCVGAISVMSSVLDFVKMLDVPFSMRANISFSLSIKDEYALTWETFFNNSIPYDAAITTPNYATYAPQDDVTTAVDVPLVEVALDDTNLEELDYETQAAFLDSLMDDDDDFFGDMPSSSDEPVTPAVAEPTVEPVKEPEAPSFKSAFLNSLKASNQD